MEGALKPCDRCGALVAVPTLAPTGEYVCADCYRALTGIVPPGTKASPAQPGAPGAAGKEAKAKTIPPSERLSVPVVLSTVLMLIAILAFGGALAAFIFVPPSRFAEDLPIGAAANGIDRLAMLLGVLIGTAALVGIVLVRIEEKLEELIRRRKA